MSECTKVFKFRSEYVDIGGLVVEVACYLDLCATIGNLQLYALHGCPTGAPQVGDNAGSESVKLLLEPGAPKEVVRESGMNCTRLEHGVDD